MKKRQARKKHIDLGPRGTLLLDDRWLNDAESWLDHVATFCDREYGRKPFLEDLRGLIATVLGSGRLEQWFADGATTEVKDVTIKTAKRAVMPADARVGDVLAIPLGKKRYGFARVMRSAKGEGLLVEALRKVAHGPEFDKATLVAPRLGTPVFVNRLETLESGRWTIVGNDAAYRVAEADKALEFTYPTKRATWAARMPFDPSKKERAISAEEFRALPRGSNTAAEVVEDAIRKAMK